MNSATRAVVAATLAAAAMIGNQVGGKALRDALFLSNFEVTRLPAMLVAAAATSVLAVVLTSRLLARRGPGPMVPAAFGASAALHLVEWALVGTAPGPTAILLYLHVAVLGSILISGFWTLVNERFDPHTARVQMGRIAAGSTVGGLLGGILAERVATLLGMEAGLPMLAILHAGCAVATGILRPDAPATTRGAPDPPPDAGRSHPSGALGETLGLLRDTPYLRNIARMVVLGTLTAALLDYVFKARAAATFVGQEELVRFFGLFYTGVSLLTFLVQSGLGRRVLTGLGIGGAVATLPAAVGVGAGLSLLAPGLIPLAIARGLEATARNSLFRSGYELLWSPLDPIRRRATKPVVDVGVDRLGDALGGGIVSLVLVVAAANATSVLLGLVAGLAVVGLLVAHRLRQGWKRALEQSLLDLGEAHRVDHPRASAGESLLLSVGALDLGQLSASGLLSATNLSSLAPSDGTRTGKGGAESAGGGPAGDGADGGLAASAAAGAASTGTSGRGIGAGAAPVTDPVARRVIELRCRDPKRVIRALRSAPLDPEIAGHAVPLLAWDVVCKDVIRALTPVAPRIPGLLADALLDPDEDFAIRRRVPRVLVHAGGARTVDALVRGLADRRFEVRFQCGRALAAIADREDRLEVDPDRIYGAVVRETEVERRVWEGQRLLDELEELSEDADHADVAAEFYVRDRSSRSLDHVFTLLSLVLPRQALLVAYRGLHTSDDELRGTSLEYMESVLPRRVRDVLWPYLEDERRSAKKETRSREAILDDLMRSNESILLNLDDLRRELEE